MAKEKKKTLGQVLPYVLVVGAAIGLLASFILTLDKFAILKDPNYQPSCNLNPVLSCGSIIDTPQAQAFGFPNPLIGLVGFAVVITVGMGILAGAQYRRWFWRGLEAGTIFGLLFVHWLMYQSLYVIGALCIYCMIVWSVTIPIFWYTTLYNLRNGHIPVPTQLKGIAAFIQKHHVDILLAWFLIIIGLIVQRFWYYWSTLL